MVELAPFIEHDIDRLVGWIPDAVDLSQWAASGFAWPFMRTQMEVHMRENVRRQH
jgi:hypothetical protein